MPGLPPGRFDDLTVFLAVAESGSMAGAARELSVDPSTVSRRVGRLEAEMGIALFQRTGQGMALSEAGQRLADRLRPAVDLVQLGIEEAVRPPDRLEGLVRVTAPTEIGAEFLVPVIERFVAAHPGVEIALDLGARMVELSRREADLALRTARPTQGDVVTRRLGGGELVAVHAPSLDPAIAGVRFLAWLGIDPIVDPLVATRPEASVVLRTNDLAGLRAACRAGMGTAIMPGALAEFYDLTRLHDIDPIPAPPMWLAAPRTSRELPRVRGLWDAIVDAWESLL